MKNVLILCCCLSASAQAQVHSNYLIESLNVDGGAQSAVAKLDYDFGFPDGAKQAIYTFKCPQGNLDVLSYESDEDAMFSDGPKRVDEDATKLFKKAKLINSKSPYAIFKLQNSSYKVFCRKNVLVSDFSGMAKTLSNESAEGERVALIKNVVYLGQVTLSIPVLDSHITLVMPDSFKTLDQVKTVSLGTSGVLSPDLIAQVKGSGLFLFQASSNTLLPLQYDGRTGKAAVINGIKIPADRMLTFYYTNNYNMNGGWTKISVDLKNYQTWNEDSSKPLGSKILP